MTVTGDMGNLLFWIFMLVMALMIPVMMILLGRRMSTRPFPYGSQMGFRTPRSTVNEETWLFSQIYMGRLWFRAGLVMLPLSLVPMLLVFGKDEDPVGLAGGLICGLQSVPMIATIIKTELALRRNYTKYGTRKR